MASRTDIPGDGRDLVPNEATALQVGTAILRAYYGPELFQQFEPYSAHLMHGSWAIVGDSPADKQARLKNSVSDLTTSFSCGVVLLHAWSCPRVTLR